MALRNDLTEGNVRKQILRFVLPIVMTNALQALYNAVDMFFVGQFSGTAALSAVAVAGPVMNIMIMTVSGLSVGVGITIGGHVGAGKGEKVVRDCANTAIKLYLIIAFFVTVLGVIFTPFIVSLVQTPPEAVEGAISYMRIVFIGIIGMFGYNLIGAFQRGCGDAKTPFYFVLAATIINVILDWLFVGPFDMGASGAAIATIIAQGASFVMGVVYFEKKKHIITFRPKEWKIDKTQLELIFRVGLPTAVQALLNNLSMTTVSGVANSFGVFASAGFGVANKVQSFLSLPMQAVDNAIATFASQNVGAKKPERALQGLKEAIKIAIVFSILAIVIILPFAPQLARIFNESPEVVRYASEYMRIYCFTNLWMGIMFACSGFLRGTGNTMFSLVSCIMTQYVTRIPLVFILSRGSLGFNGIAVASSLSVLVSLSIYGYGVLSGRWLRSKEVMRANALRDQAQADGAELAGNEPISIEAEG